MFTLFKKKKNTEVMDGKNESPEKEQPALSSESNFEINAELGGVKGWPSNVSVVNYNAEQGLIFAGTESGSMFAYGKGFQYFRPCPTENLSSILFIVPIGDEICLAVYKNNSVAVLRTPSLVIVDVTQSNWMTNSDESGGEITCVHVDEYTEGTKTFVYIGTSEGNLYVIEVSAFGMIRICDYSLSTTDVELPSDMRITALLSDEKCIIIAFGKTDKRRNSVDREEFQTPPASPVGAINESTQGVKISSEKVPKKGAVIVYNMTKKRTRHVYSTVSEVTSMVWDSTKDSLYAVLKNGEILCVDTCSGRSLSRTVWNANPSVSKEKKDDSKRVDKRRKSAILDDIDIENDYASDIEFDDDGNKNENLVIVKQIKWLPPQISVNTNNSEGCFFLLLSSRMKDTVIGLAPAGPHGEMMEVISFPPLSNGGISDFFLVPIFSSKECNKEIDDCNPGCISGTISPVNHTTIPALLLISQSSIWNEFDENEYDFHNENCRNQSGSRSRKKSAINVYDIGNKFDENDVSSEDYIDNVRGSKGKELSLLPCPIGVSTIPTSASGATPIAIAVAIAVAITDATSPNGKEAEGFGGSIMRSFLPSETIANVTCLNALLPCTVLTSLAAVLSLPKVDDMASKNPASRFDKGETHKNTRRSSFENSEGEGLGPEPIENKEVVTSLYEVVLATHDNGSSSGGNKSSRVTSTKTSASSSSSLSHDLVLLGQSDGSIGIWSVSPSSHSSKLTKNTSPENLSQNSTPSDETQNFKGKEEKIFHTVWTLLRTLRCTLDSVTDVRILPAASSLPDDILKHSKGIGISLIHTEENSGLFAYGTFRGDIVVWEVFELSTSIGFIEHTARQHSNEIFSHKEKDFEDLNWDEDDDEEDEGEEEEEDEEEDNAIVYNIKKGISFSMEAGTFHPGKRKEMLEKQSDNIDMAHSSSSCVTPSQKRKQNLKIKSFEKALNINDRMNDEISSLKHHVFRPNEVREAYHVHVDGCITAQLLVSECLILVIGSATGGVWLSRGLCEGSLIEINLSGMWREPTKAPPFGTSGGDCDLVRSPVIGFVYSTYSENNELIPAIYCIFHCGSVAIVSLQRGILIAYTSSATEEATSNQTVASIWKKRVIPKDTQGTDPHTRERNTKIDKTKNYGEKNDKEMKEESEETRMEKTVVATAVTDVSYNIIKRPEYKAIFHERVSSTGKKSAFLFHLLVSKDTSSEKFHTARTDVSEEPIVYRPRSYSSVDVRTPTADIDQNDSFISPKYLLVVVGRELVTYDISKFSRLILGSKPRSRSNTVTSNTPNGYPDDSSSEANFSVHKSAVEASQVLSSSSFIIGQHLLYVEGASRAWTDPLSCFSLINEIGIMSTITLKSRAKVCETSLLQQFADNDAVLSLSAQTTSSIKDSLILKSGVLLSNGNCYLLQQNGLILNTNLSKKSTHILTAPLPTRVLTNTSLPTSSSLLYPGQEQESKIGICQGLLKKQQSSMFGGRGGVHSGPADLIKLFTKTRDLKYVRQRNKSSDRLKELSVDFEEKDSVLDRFNETEKEISMPEKTQIKNEKVNSPLKTQLANKLNLFLSKDKSINQNQNEQPPVRRNTFHGSDLSTAQSAMSENLKTLEERGEALRMTSLQADELKNGAETYRDLVKRQRNELEKKNRWGGLL